MIERTDAELIALARGGNRDACGELLARHYSMAVRVAQRMVGEAELARELVQEAMLQAFLSLEHLQEVEAFTSWLYGIVLNVCRSYRRDQKTSFYSLETLNGGSHADGLRLADLGLGPDDLAEARDMHRRVLEAVGELSPKLRRATLLFYFEQLSVREIAALLDISVGAVKGRLHKARKTLEEWLWPLYAEEYKTATEKRRTAMVRIEIADVVEQDKDSYKVQLVDEKKERTLKIIIGAFEGRALAMGLRSLSLPRPISYQFTSSIMDALGAELLDVRIDSLRESTFYAIARVRNGKIGQEVDARPSDALVLAVLRGCPLYATKKVWETAARECTVEMRDGFGEGLEKFAKEFQSHEKKPKASRVFYVDVDEVPEAKEGREIRVEIGRGWVDNDKAKNLQEGDVLMLDRKMGDMFTLYLDGKAKFLGEARLSGEMLCLMIKKKVEAYPSEEAEDYNLSVELGRTYLADEKVADLGPQSTVRLDRKVGDDIDVRIDGRLCARGEVVAVEQQLGVRITAVAAA